jgi:integrase
MATFQVRNGRVRAIIRRPNLTASKTFSRLADARLWARMKEREADLADVVPGRAQGTLGDLLDRYEREVWPVKRWGKSKAYDLKALEADLGPTPLAAITKQTVIDYAQTLAQRMDRPGIATRLSYLRTVLTVARDLWGMTTPVAALDEALAVAKLHKITGRGVPRTRRPLPEELDKIVDYAEASKKSTVDLGEIIRVLEVLPLRIGELVGIEWDDLRPDERAVVIRSRKHPDRRVKEVNDDVVSLIKVGKVDTYDLIAGRPRYYTRPFPYAASTISNGFWMATTALGIKNLHLHDLRASAISVLLALGTPIPVVASISGHKNWKILASIYSRITPAEAHAAMARVQAT